MKKQFKSKKKKNKGFLFLIIVILLSLFLNNELLQNASTAYLLESDVKHAIPIRFDKDKLLLSLGLNYHKKEKKKTNPTITTTKKVEEELPAFNEIKYLEPSIYIYNTHQAEEYTNGTVLDAGKKLKEKLEANHIKVTLETKNIPKEIKEKNLAYKDSYKITRELLQKNMTDDTVFYIDLHRDSMNYKTTTTTINDKNYAKLMFVVGGKHSTYKQNYNMANKLNKLVENFNKSISRGIFVRQSSSYNQDLASNILLIELGGPNNSLEEVDNTLTILADAISQYIGE